VLVDLGGGTPQAFTLQTFGAIDVQLGRGDDFFGLVGNSSIAGKALRVDGSAGGDAILGGPGNDTLTGGPGHDTVDGGLGKDTIFGGGLGNDVVESGPGTFEFLGGGNDVALGTPVGSTRERSFGADNARSPGVIKVLGTDGSNANLDWPPTVNDEAAHLTAARSCRCPGTPIRAEFRRLHSQALSSARVVVVSPDVVISRWSDRVGSSGWVR
jgi:hypothetical protein